MSTRRQTTITVSVAVAVFGIIGAVSVGIFRWARDDAVWKSNVERDIADIAATLSESNPEAWARKQMRAWVRASQELNPDWKGASVDEVPE